MESAGKQQSSFMQQALALARKSPPKPTNYCVGAVLIDEATSSVISTGYTLECEGNTHAEQCCFLKLARQHNVPEERLAEVLPVQTALYTTMEPCGLRLSGNKTCVDRILGLGTGIKKVYVGVLEPEKFVGENVGRQKLEQAGIQVVKIEGLEKEILDVATAGHIKGGA